MRLTDLAIRTGRWSVTRPRRAIAAWLAFVACALLVGGIAGTRALPSYEAGFGESGRADRLLHSAGLTSAASENVLVRGRDGRVAEPAVQIAVRDLAGRLRRLPEVASVRAPRDARPGPLVAADGRSALVQVRLRGELDEAAEKVPSVAAAVAAVRLAHPSVELSHAGDASMLAAMDKVVEDDLRTAEVVSLPLTFAILFLAFGAIVAAGVPVLLGVGSVAAAFGLVALPSRLVALEESTYSVILLIGLAVGVDYALFYLRREREERDAGREPTAALEAAAATSGRAVIVSGLTVMVSVLALFATGNRWQSSYAVGIVTVVAIAVAGSLTVLPAVLSLLGDRVDRGRLPRLRRAPRPRAEGGAWTLLVGRVLRRPWIALATSTGVLVALGVPALGMQLGDQGMGSLPRDEPAVAAFDDIRASFPAGSPPAVVAVEADDVTAAPVRAGIAALTRRAAAAPGLGAPVAVDVDRRGRTARIVVPVTGDGVERSSLAAVRRLRRDVLPATLGRVPGVRVQVGGTSAAAVDLRATTLERLPLVVGLVLGFGFVALLLAFRSLVVPLKAIALNLLSAGAALGVVTLVFQHGWGAELLGFTPTGRVSSWLPVMIFVILFGLSTDYHVLVVTRIREHFDAGAGMDEAVAAGIRSTAGVVTSAAAVMVAVFSVFATLGLLELKQFGVGLAVAILIDATLVRAVLLPAAMKLLGEWNWWLPGRRNVRHSSSLVAGAVEVPA